MDDLLLGATVAGGVGRGCEKRPLICAVELGGPGRRGRCATRVAGDCKGGTYADFAEERADVLSRVVTDDRNGIRGGLAGWPNLDQRRFDAADPEGALPAARHVISSFRAWVQGAFHGLSRVRLQGCADEFSWRCSQRGSGGISTALLRDCTLGYATISQLLGSFSPQPSGGSVRARGRSGRERRGEGEGARRGGQGEGGGGMTSGYAGCRGPYILI